MVVVLGQITVDSIFQLKILFTKIHSLKLSMYAHVKIARDDLPDLHSKFSILSNSRTYLHSKCIY